jgi:hypothetical protein
MSIFPIIGMIEYCKLYVEVYDKIPLIGTSALIGKGECALLSLSYEGIYNIKDKGEKYIINLEDNHKSTGKVIINASLREQKAVVDLKDIKFADDFDCGCLDVKAISAYRLANTEFWGKQVSDVISLYLYYHHRYHNQHYHDHHH